MTLRYVYGQDRNVARFVASLIPHIDPAGFPANAAAIGIVDGNNNPRAGFVFYDWSVPAGTIYVAGAAKRGAFWFSRETIRRAAAFAFEQRRCQMVIMRVRADAERLLMLLAAFGFGFVTVPRLYGRDCDGIIATYTAEDWAESRFNRLAATQQKDAA